MNSEKYSFQRNRRVKYMSDLQELTEELLIDPEFKREYESLQPEMDNIRAFLDAEINSEKTVCSGVVH